MARFGVMMAIMAAVSFVAAPLFGWLMDHVNRVTATIIALTFATAGYLSMGVITSPLDFAMLPYFIVLSLGSSFMLKSSLALIGQEAPPKERASVIATNSLFGALGILILTVVGGRLYDAWGPWAPFVLAGAYQAVLLIVAIIIRIVAPGISVAEQKQLQAQMSAAD
jgi:MFS family permease